MLAACSTFAVRQTAVQQALVLRDRGGEMSVLWMRFVIPSVMAVILAVLSVAVSSATPVRAHHVVPSTGNIEIRDGPNPGEVVISWEAVPQATHYRIGYVNMEVDYHLATASCTGEWIEAFVYVDVNARNIPVSNGRAEYTVRRLSPGAAHAFTVLTSNNFVDSGGGGSVSSEFFWPPQGSRWERLSGRNTRPPGVTLPTGECTEPAATQTAPPPTGNIAVREGDNPGEAVISWDAVSQATHYRIGYVNMEVDYHLATASCTGEWIEAFVYVDVNARNIPVSNGRAEYTIRRLSPGAAHAFTVLTSNNFVDSGGGGSVSSEFFWPPVGSRWERLSGRNALPPGMTLPTPDCFVPLPAVDTDASTDRAALVSLYNATGGANWANNANWLSDAPVGQWHGVTTDETGRVTELNLEENGLTGLIPPQIANLTSLEVLNLNKNLLTGAIPGELAHLSNLTELRLWQNQLTGPVPIWLGDLSDLKVLDLDQNRLTGTIPAELAGLSNLTYLGLHSNELTGAIPPELGNLSNLTELSLHSNVLTGEIPPELGNLSNLSDLRLYNNRLTGQIPAWLGDLSNLRVLYLDRNQLTGQIPEELRQLSSPMHLSLYGNELTGTVPPWLGELSNLETLWLGDNRLTGAIPTELQNLGNLQQLSLYNNRLTGAIPTELGQLTNLTRLNLRNNDLTGTIPVSLGSVSDLEQLYLHFNRLTGEIPSELGSLSKLEYLYLGGNDFGGPIPTELHNLSDLKGLGLWDNNLSGTIPIWVGEFEKLERLYLYRNQLTGPVPASLGQLSRLIHLDLAENELAGPIPAELGNLTSLTWLELQYNFLTGEIPASLNNLVNLERIRLQGNALSGCIPTALQHVAENDLGRLGLLFCGEQPAQQTIDDYVVWKIGDQVNAAVEAEIREAVSATHDTFIRYGMPRIDQTLTIFVYHDPDALEAAVKEVTGRTINAADITTSSGDTTFIINTSSERFQSWSSEALQQQIVGHMVRINNSRMSDLNTWASPDEVPPAGPAWLMPGAARYFTWQTLRPEGPASCDQTRDRYARIRDPVDTPLRQAETSSGYSSLRNSSAYTFLAVELLAEQAGPESVISYYASLHPRTTWQEAFQTAFGMTIDEFYGLYEERRAAGFPRSPCETLPALTTLPDAPDYTHWYVGDNVPQEYVDEIVKGTRLMHDYAASRVMPESGGKIRIYLPGDLDTIAAITSALTGWSLERSRAYWNPGFAMAGESGVPDGSWIITNTFSSNYASTNPESRMKVAAHEIFHAYQKALSALRTGGSDDDVPPAGPRWLTEGSAEFFAYKAMDAGGVLSYDTERSTRFVETAKREDRPLSEMGNLHGVRGVSYQFFLLAAELLAHHAGDDALIQFYSLQHPETTWEEAFNAAFGMTVDEFYDLFETHRANGFPAVHVLP